MTSITEVDNTTENVNETTTISAPANDLDVKYYPSSPLVGKGALPGPPFDDKDVDKIKVSKLIAIRVKTVMDKSVVHGFQCVYKFGGEIFNGPYHGRTYPDGEFYTFELQPGEHIVGFRGRASTAICGIQFFTNKDRHSPFYGYDLPEFPLFQGSSYELMPEDVDGGLQWISGITQGVGDYITSFTAWWTKQAPE